MAERTEYAPGTPAWVDIGTDVEGAKQFYAGLFGWGSQDAGPPDETGGYGFFTKGGKLVAGYGPQQNPGPPAWTTYVSVTDADKTAKRARDAGGTVVLEPMQVMDAGRMGVLRDPQVTVNFKAPSSSSALAFQSMAVSVDGEVKRSGAYPVAGRMTLMRAVALAGGVTEYAKLDDVVVFRTGETSLVVYRSEFAGTNKANAVVWGVGGEIEGIVADLKSKGVAFEHYEGMDLQGDIHVAGEMKMVWFKDPDGNILHLNNM